jgi:O-antigen/teichoic acid export membrane protein
MFKYNSIVKMLSIGTGYILTVVLGNIVDKDVFGMLSVYIITFPIAIAFVHMGLTRLALKVGSLSVKYGIGKTKYIMHETSRKLTINYLVIGALSAVFYYLSEIESRFTGHLAWTVAIWFGAQSSVKSIFMQATNRAAQAHIPEKIAKPLLLILLLIAMAKNDLKLDINACLYAYSMATIMAYYTFPKKLIHLDHDEKKASINHSADITYRAATPFGIIIILQLVTASIEIIILTHMATLSEIAEYRIAQQFSLIVGVGLQVVVMYLAPYVVRLKKENKVEDLQKIINRGWLISTTIALIVLFVYAVYGAEILHVLYGDKYKHSVELLTLMAITQLINVLFGPVALVLNMLDDELYVLRTLIVIIIASAILIPIAYKVGGLYSVAAASLMISFSWNGILYLRCRSAHKISTIYAR